MFFIADDLVEEFRGGTSRDGKSGQQAKREPENGDHAGGQEGGFVIHLPSLRPGIIMCRHKTFARRFSARRALLSDESAKRIYFPPVVVVVVVSVFSVWITGAAGATTAAGCTTVVVAGAAVTVRCTTTLLTTGWPASMV
jgi:hypothetical protein